VNAFRSARSTLGNIDAEAAASLIAAAADVSLILDADGIIRDLACSNADLGAELQATKTWIDRPWIDTVAPDSRNKIELLLQAAPNAGPHWRHVNHPGRNGVSIAVLYSAVSIGDSGNIIAFGRDLSPISTLQQRLVDAQQSMERDYARLRQMETRYRLLFDMSSDAVLVLDATTQKVLEANRAALQLLGRAERRVIGRPFVEILDPDGERDGQTVLASVRANGRSDEMRASLARTRREVMVSASLFRQEDAQLILVRLSPAPGDADPSETEARNQVLRAIEHAPDGFVVTNTDGQLLTANMAFLEMAGLVSEEVARGRSLEDWIGRPGVDFDVLVANLRQRGSVRLFATVLRSEGGATTDVEISAVAVSNNGTACFGFALRNVSRRLQAEPQGHSLLPRSVEQLTELIGRMPLKEVVREATDVIERLCIEAALELTGDNRASAAEMLQLSRQSLYVKLRRYGLGDLSDPHDS
jgi:transcriptional regulator PpsR